MQIGNSLCQDGEKIRVVGPKFSCYDGLFTHYNIAIAICCFMVIPCICSILAAFIRFAYLYVICTTILIIVMVYFLIPIFLWRCDCSEKTRLKIYSNYNKYSSVKDKLFIRVCKADELSKEKLPENVPYHIRDDFLITCYIYCNDSPEYSVLVDERLLLLYGISQDQLFYDAAANSESLFPFSVQGILILPESWSNEPGDIERYFYNVRDNILQTRSKDCLKMGVYH